MEDVKEPLEADSSNLRAFDNELDLLIEKARLDGMLAALNILETHVRKAHEDMRAKEASHGK